MPIVVKRPKALGDLAQIWDYIADDSEERADAFIATIDAKFQIKATTYKGVKRPASNASASLSIPTSRPSPAPPGSRPG